mmetsp:Transcript_18316/g.29798  ORF Transcript_18316/g.29798 Transcript_18316/m.29798 type:complete len:348 (+) Transcript_18316:42-1085(+)
MEGVYSYALSGHEQTMSWGSEFLQTLFSGNSLGELDPSALDSSSTENKPFPVVLFWELTLIQFIMNAIVRMLIVQPLAKQLLLANAGRARKVTHLRVVKFSQATLEMLFYSVYFVMGWRIVQSQPYLWPSTLWWTNQPDNRFITNDASFFYIAYCARYMQNFIFVFLEPKRKDFWEMQTHHLVTIILIWISYSYGFVRVGLVVMVLLDIADPPLHLGKQCIYVKEIRGRQSGIFTWANMGDFFFVIFAVSFIVTRLMLYPYVVWSCTVELYNAKAKPGPFDFFEYKEAVGIETIICVALIWVLMLLQIFWGVLLMKAIIKVFSGAELKDTRSDSEQSGSESEKKKTK